jgi:hypothetical protein
MCIEYIQLSQELCRDSTLCSTRLFAIILEYKSNCGPASPRTGVSRGGAASDLLLPWNIGNSSASLLSLLSILLRRAHSAGSQRLLTAFILPCGTAHVNVKRLLTADCKGSRCRILKREELWPQEQCESRVSFLESRLYLSTCRGFNIQL